MESVEGCLRERIQAHKTMAAAVAADVERRLPEFLCKCFSAVLPAEDNGDYYMVTDSADLADEIRRDNLCPDDKVVSAMRVWLARADVTTADGLAITHSLYLDGMIRTSVSGAANERRPRE